MGRPNRDFTTDNRFHVINRGVDSQDLFSVDDDWVLFESLIANACDNYGLRINAYALMSNHYHVLVDLTDCDDRVAVSESFGVVQSTYANYFNNRTHRRGPLFEPRFLSYGVDGETRTHRAARYIHRNPIDICGPRALGAYRWSSLPVALGRRESPPWLDCEPIAPNDADEHLSELTDCKVVDLWPLDGLPPQRRTSLDAIELALARVGPTGNSPAVDRSVICVLGLDLRAGDVTEIANRFSRSTTQVRRAASQARTRARDDPSFSRLIERIQVELIRR
ncbi:MAG: transposase [Ilumatobacter sp.]|uniref:transposase n=1 Tax=Ilumatobacter sp. TaxID=1967498 RepID=UPI003C7946BC